LGIGVNVSEGSVPPEAELSFPAASVAGCLAASGRALTASGRAPTASGRAPEAVDRLELLRAILASLLEWRSRLGSPEFVRTWEERLAFRDEWVRIVGTGPGAEAAWEGQVLGLEGDGALRLRDGSGRVRCIQAGEVHLRAADRS
jgi:biotin-(acetyl-CoA carboxylase) ligase